MTIQTAPKLTLLPKYASTEVVKPGTRVGKGGNPHHYLVDGVKHSRVTTILNDTMPKSALVPWATRLGVEKMAQMVFDHPLIDDESLSHAEYLHYLAELAYSEPEAVKDAAADWGTRAHQAVQAHIDHTIRGEPYVPDPEMTQTVEGFSAFDQSLNIQWLATELTVWDDDLLGAGTVDGIGWSPTGWVIADWKTGRGHYPEMALQLSAYAAMFGRITGETITHGYVVRFPREQPSDGATFEARQVADLKLGWTRYQALVAQRAYVKAGVWTRDN